MDAVNTRKPLSQNEQNKRAEIKRTCEAALGRDFCVFLAKAITEKRKRDAMEKFDH